MLRKLEYQLCSLSTLSSAGDIKIAVARLPEVARSLDDTPKTLKTMKKLCDTAVNSLPPDLVDTSGYLTVDAVPAILCLVGIDVSRAAWESIKPRISEHVARHFVPAERSAAAAAAPQDQALVLVGQPGQQPHQARVKLLTEQQYGELPHEALVACVLRRDAEIRVLQKACTKLKRTSARQLQNMERALVVARSLDVVDPNAEWQIERRGTLKLTESATFAVAIRKSLTNMAAGDLGIAAMGDLSRHAVYRCETDTAAALIASCRSFHRESEQSAGGHIASGNDVIISHAYRSDATSSNVWQRSKLCGLELETCYSLGVGGLVAFVGLTLLRCAKVQNLLPIVSCKRLALSGKLDQTKRAVRHLGSCQRLRWMTACRLLPTSRRERRLALASLTRYGCKVAPRRAA